MLPSVDRVRLVMYAMRPSRASNVATKPLTSSVYFCGPEAKFEAVREPEVDEMMYREGRRLRGALVGHRGEPDEKAGITRETPSLSLNFRRVYPCLHDVDGNSALCGSISPSAASSRLIPSSRTLLTELPGPPIVCV
ncbi:hypothetical protein BGW80DRAFT_1277425 [Lactifluus volemus]|nr:hypothetical protein BGW80DRAFT_1277425 [Lactifluus volemus]